MQKVLVHCILPRFLGPLWQYSGFDLTDNARTAWHEYQGGASCAVRALCPPCAKSRLFFTGSPGSQGPEFCTLQPLLVHQGFFVLV